MNSQNLSITREWGRLVVSVTVALLAVGGCASSPATLAKAVSVPTERIYWITPAGATATIVVLGDGGLALALMPTREVVVDGVLAGRIERAEVMRIAVAPGEHVLGVRTPASVTDSTLKTGVVTAEAGKTYYFGIASDSSGSVTLSRAMPPVQ